MMFSYPIRPMFHRAAMVLMTILACVELEKAQVVPEPPDVALTATVVAAPAATVRVEPMTDTCCTPLELPNAP
jgi:hypothetical protein